MERLTVVLERLGLARVGAALGNEGALANAGALRHEHQREGWQVAALERALAGAASTEAAPLRRSA